jgi:hypothetical protein
MAARGRSLAAIDRDPDVTQAEQVIRALGGTGVEAAALRPVSGGCIHQAWWAELADGSSRFVKASVTAPEDAFEREAEGLAALDAAGAIRVPREVVAGEGEGVRFLVMEAISTGAPPSTSFCLPVKTGWHSLQSSTVRSPSTVDRVVNVLPHEHRTVVSV